LRSKWCCQAEVHTRYNDMEILPALEKVRAFNAAQNIMTTQSIQDVSPGCSRWH
jgi:hypothetical protein